MQLLPQGGSGTVQASSDAAKRTKSAGKTRCQACLSLSINGILINDIPLACGMLGGISRADNCDW